MNTCPNCNAALADMVTQCPYCNTKIGSSKQTSLGKASLAIGIASLFCFVLMLMILFSGSTFWIIASFLALFCFVLPIVAIVLGAVAYFGKSKDKYGLIGFILGLCMIIAGPIGMAATTYMYVSHNIQQLNVQEFMPLVSFIKQERGDTYSILAFAVGSDSVSWSDLRLLIDGSAINHGKTGFVQAGDSIDLTSLIGNDSYTVSIIYTPTEIIIFEDTFP
jgi:hypothetical protein